MSVRITTGAGNGITIRVTGSDPTAPSATEEMTDAEALQLALNLIQSVSMKSPRNWHVGEPHHLGELRDDES